MYILFLVGPNVTIDHAFGREFPEMSSQQYQLAIHCGGCMLDRQKQHARISDLTEAKVSCVVSGHSKSLGLVMQRIVLIFLRTCIELEAL